MLKIFLLIFFLSCFLKAEKNDLCLKDNPAQNIDLQSMIDTEIDIIQTEYGIKINYNTSAPDFFHETWVKDADVKPKATQANFIALLKTIRTIKIALEKYPKNLLSSNLQNIHIAKSLNFFGNDYGGTYRTGYSNNKVNNSLYLASGSIDSADLIHSDISLERIFHAELSSIFIKDYHKYFDSKAWSRLNPPNFKYGNNVQQALTDDSISSETGTSKSLPNGFVTDYAMTEPENDFNSIAGLYFTDLPKLQDYSKKFPVIKSKAKYLESFYNNINSNNWANNID